MKKAIALLGCSLKIEMCGVIDSTAFPTRPEDIGAMAHHGVFHALGVKVHKDMFKSKRIFSVVGACGPAKAALDGATAGDERLSNRIKQGVLNHVEAVIAAVQVGAMSVPTTASAELQCMHGLWAEWTQRPVPHLLALNCR